MKKIAITGSKGRIGTVLRKGLAGKFQITQIAKPKHNVKNYKQLLKTVKGHDVIIHLAWNTKVDNVGTNKIDPDNALMFWNVYRAALKAKVKRVIVASSVHADFFYKWPKKKMSPYSSPTPDSPYGAHKVFMESLGKYYSTKGLEVICIRFGGVLANNNPVHRDHPERAAWFSHRDCVSLITACISAKKVPNNFAIIYGVSNNKRRIHSTMNPFGWKPKDS